ncbi:MAG: ABC transporter ATP-binding protein [Burkholderiaceae bacterium]
MFDRLFRSFESRIDATATPPAGPPPPGLLAFYWHFVRQARVLFLAMLLSCLLVALSDTVMPVLIGKLVALMTATNRPAALHADWPMLMAMVAFLLVLRPIVLLFDSLLRFNAVMPGLTNMVRWQNHWHVVRQSWPFFQDDFAGRIANRVMQTGNALRESAVSGVRAVWYIVIYGLTTIVLLALADWRLAVPTVCWFAGYVIFLRYFVPRMRDLSKRSSEARSKVMAHVVDSYTNILTVKLFARPSDEDGYVRDVIDAHKDAMGRHMRIVTQFIWLLWMLNALLLVATAAVGLALWQANRLEVGVFAMALPLAWQITSAAGWVSWEVAGIFENVGVVQEGMLSIAVPHRMVDRPDAVPLQVPRGEIRFEHLGFGYDAQRPVLRDIDLTIRPGERIGLVGRSGAGKSTLVNLLLRFFDPNSGRILVDGQDIAQATQDSVRAQIGMVTQDTSLLHRSITDNVRYGKPEAGMDDIVAAARKAQAYEFIQGLRDWQGREGFDAHVGERGVKLSGGQRQRIAIARVVLKDAPILILDEATSALDSEVELAIQEQLLGLMAGKTVIAIAHRLSTIARLDRLVVLDEGRIVEAGSHDELLALGGHYSQLWRHQSGGFLADRLPDAELPASGQAEELV